MKISKQLLNFMIIGATNNLMVCDASGQAACVELGFKQVAVRRPVKDVLYSTNHFQSKELGGTWMCWRLPRLRKGLSEAKALDVARAQALLGQVSYRMLTMHSMVYRPASRSFWLAIGEPPATQHKFVLLDRATLFPPDDGDG